jgi:hypothetical protein
MSSSPTSPTPATPSPIDVLDQAYARLVSGVSQLSQDSTITQKRLENEFNNLDQCVSTHETQLKDYKRLVQMLKEIPNTPQNSR